MRVLTWLALAALLAPALALASGCGGQPTHPIVTSLPSTTGMGKAPAPPPIPRNIPPPPK